MKPHEKAFTLIELLIVVAIIAILAAIAVPNLHEASVRARVSRAKSDLRTMTTAIEAYHVDYQYYPLVGVLNANGTMQNPHVTPAGQAAHKFAHEGLTTPIAYITTLPEDPFIAPARSPLPEWRPYYARYFFTNLEWFQRLMGPSPPPVIEAMKQRYGPWILASAGPDLDRLDLALHLYYDPSNGTISDGDIVRSSRLNY